MWFFMILLRRLNNKIWHDFFPSHFTALINIDSSSSFIQEDIFSFIPSEVIKDHVSFVCESWNRSHIYCFHSILSKGREEGEQTRQGPRRAAYPSSQHHPWKEPEQQSGWEQQSEEPGAGSKHCSRDLHRWQKQRRG
jgi:hypothetical protein